MRVLIAEDDLVSRRVLEKFLAKWGYEVLSAGSGAEAWEILQRDDAPHLIILDWMMPGVGGVELCRMIRKAGKPSPAHIILVTARAGKADIVEGLQAGAGLHAGTVTAHRACMSRISRSVLCGSCARAISITRHSEEMSQDRHPFRGVAVERSLRCQQPRRSHR